MGLEIEHKYLVKDDSYKKMSSETIDIRQGYLSRVPERTVRVRTWNDRGFLTVKGITTGAVRKEFEYEIPYRDACEMLSMCCPPILHKTRHIVEYKGHKWEVDEFHEGLVPLVTAEIELSHPDEEYEKPDFIGEDVTGGRATSTPPLPTLVEGAENFLEFVACIGQQVYYLKSLGYVVTVLVQLLLGRFDTKTFHFDKIVNHPERPDVLWFVVSLVCRAAARLYFRKFGFPVSQRAGRHIEQFRDIPDFVVLFVEVVYYLFHRAFSYILRAGLIHHMARILGLTNHFGILLRSEVHEVVVDGILRFILEPYLIMKVRPSGLSG